MNSSPSKSGQYHPVSYVRTKRRSPLFPILLIIMAAALAVGAYMALDRYMSRHDGATTTAPSVEPYVSPYDFSGLVQQENGRFAYTEDGVVSSLTGIDVSHLDGEIDWNAVAADGIDFAIIRLGNRGTSEGGIYLDNRYRSNIEGATAAGIPIGVYFFSQAASEEEAIQEAQFVLDNLSGVALTYPVIFDEEVIGTDSRVSNLTPEQFTANARAFCDYLRQRGIPVMIYGNRADLDHLIIEELSDIPVWYAQYEASYPDAQVDFCMWQYTDKGHVAGIAGEVDMSIRFTTPEANAIFDKAR